MYPTETFHQKFVTKNQLQDNHYMGSQLLKFLYIRLNRINMLVVIKVVGI
jgi:hypothetical protein